LKKVLVCLGLIIFTASSLSAAGAAEKKWMKQGNALYGQRQYLKAAAAYENALKANPGNTAAHLYAGYCYVYAGDKARALAHLQAAYKKNRDRKLGAYIEKLKNGGVSPQSSFAGEYLKGGVGRLAGMGGVDISVPDAASMIDAYDDGFTSAVLARERADVRNASPVVDMHSRKAVWNDPAQDTAETSGFDISTNMYKEKNNGEYLWLSDDSVVIIKPYVRLFPDTEKDSTPGLGGGPVTTINNNEFQYALDAEYALRLMPNLSLGALMGYDSYDLTNTRSGSNDKTELDFSKFEYQVSGTYFLNKNINLSVSLGAKKSINPYYPTEISDFAAWFMPGGTPAGDNSASLLMGHFGFSEYMKTEAGNIRTETTAQIPVGGFDVNLGGGFEVPNTAEAALKLGVIAGVGGTQQEKIVTTTISTGASVTTELPQFDAYTGGMAISADFKGRYYLDFAILGARFSYAGISGKRIYALNAPPYDQSSSVVDAAGGVALKVIKNLLLPVEFVIQNASWQEKRANEDYERNLGLIGFKAGAEYSLTREMKVRAGFDFASGGTTFRSDIFGVINDNSPYGTDMNPAINQTALNLGAGYKAGSFEANAALRFAFQSQNPLEQGMKEWSGSDIMLITDIKFIM
jgi:tetratricopeptide (TPR) repeat protein